jgi:hypothetical protein
MEVIHLETACFDQWQVSFSAIQQIGLTFYTFSITDYRTGSRYEHPEVYLTTTKVYLSAYFFCLRASLDREQQPTLLVDLETGYILSCNLFAFELLSIDATGANLSDFMVELVKTRSLRQQLLQSEAAHRSGLLCNADGLLMKCKIQTQMAPHYSGWAILQFEFSQFQPCVPQLNH